MLFISGSKSYRDYCIDFMPFFFFFFLKSTKNSPQPLDNATTPFPRFHSPPLSTHKHTHTLSSLLLESLLICPCCLGNYYGTPKPSSQPPAAKVIGGEASPNDRPRPQETTPRRSKSYNEMQNAGIAPADTEDEDELPEMNSSFTGEV